MRNRVVCLVIVVSLFCASAATSFALDVSPDQFEEKLRTYDSESVEAARNYAKAFDMKESISKSIPMLKQAMTRQLKSKNPNLTEDQAHEYIDAYVQSAFVDDIGVLDRATVLLVLDIFSKDELVALNQFYSSPIGSGILKKMPTMTVRMSEVVRFMQSYVMPRASEAARAKLLKDGVEVKM
jgi:hypothetical protein